MVFWTYKKKKNKCLEEISLVFVSVSLLIKQINLPNELKDMFETLDVYNYTVSHLLSKIMFLLYHLY